MKIPELEKSIRMMSEDELRDFILDNRKAQNRYKETMAISKPKRATVTPIKSKEESLVEVLKSVDPEKLKEILTEKGIL